MEWKDESDNEVENEKPIFEENEKIEEKTSPSPLKNGQNTPKKSPKIVHENPKLLTPTENILRRVDLNGIIAPEGDFLNK